MRRITTFSVVLSVISLGVIFQSHEALSSDALKQIGTQPITTQSLSSLLRNDTIPFPNFHDLYGVSDEPKGLQDSPNDEFDNGQDIEKWFLSMKEITFKLGFNESLPRPFPKLSARELYGLPEDWCTPESQSETEPVSKSTLREVIDYWPSPLDQLYK